MNSSPTVSVIVTPADAVADLHSEMKNELWHGE